MDPHRLDADPDPTFPFDADLDPTPSLHMKKSQVFFFTLFKAASLHCFIFLVSVISDHKFQYIGHFIEIVRKKAKLAVHLVHVGPDPDPDPQHWQREAL